MSKTNVVPALKSVDSGRGGAIVSSLAKQSTQVGIRLRPRMSVLKDWTMLPSRWLMGLNQVEGAGEFKCFC